MSFTTEPTVLLPSSVAQRIRGDLRDLSRILRDHGCHQAANDVRTRDRLLGKVADVDDLLDCVTDLIDGLDLQDLADLHDRLVRLASAANLTREVKANQIAEARTEARKAVSAA